MTIHDLDGSSVDFIITLRSISTDVAVALVEFANGKREEK